MQQITINIKDNKLDQFLEHIKGLDYAEVQSNDWWNTISEKSKKLILKGKQELREGKGIPNEEIRKEIDKLLGKA